MTTTDTDWVDKIGKPAYESIAEMVAALQCDYDRLEELRGERDNWEQDEDDPYDSWADEFPDDAEELTELEEAAGDGDDEDDARQRIDEDPLSIEIGGWWSPGSEPEPTEYRILLTTGGPAVRIVGELGAYNEPDSAQLEVQDWWKPWTEYRDVDEDVLLAYVRCFYFGD